jgi:hypothetical protein
LASYFADVVQCNPQVKSSERTTVVRLPTLSPSSSLTLLHVFSSPQAAAATAARTRPRL